MSALLEVTTTLRLGREQRRHGWTLAIVDNRVRVLTRCGIETNGEYTAESGVITCPKCAEAVS